MGKCYAKNLNHHLRLYLLETPWVRGKRFTHHPKSTQRLLERKPEKNNQHHLAPIGKITQDYHQFMQPFFQTLKKTKLIESVLTFNFVFVRRN
jgi:hypothetical protein